MGIKDDESIERVQGKNRGKNNLMPSPVFATGVRAMLRAGGACCRFGGCLLPGIIPGSGRRRWILMEKKPTKDPKMSDTAQLIHSFPKNPLEEIRVSLTVFKKKQYLDLRTYYKGDDGEYHPSKKGITLSLDLLPDLVEAIQKARDVLGE
jgi:hypothetical protein